METSEEGCRVDEGTEERGGRGEAERRRGTHTATGETWWLWGKESDGVVRPLPCPEPHSGVGGGGHGGNHLDPKKQW